VVDVNRMEASAAAPKPAAVAKRNYRTVPVQGGEVQGGEVQGGEIVRTMKLPRPEEIRAALEKATQEKAAQEKAAQEKAAQEKPAKEKAAQEKAAQEKRRRRRRRRRELRRRKQRREAARKRREAAGKAAQAKATQDRAAFDRTQPIVPMATTDPAGDDGARTQKLAPLRDDSTQRLAPLRDDSTLSTLQGFYAGSVANPETFWGAQAKLIEWWKPPLKVLDYSHPPFRKWFVGGETNLCFNAVDRHLIDRGKQDALVWISTEVDQTRKFTYAQLGDEVNRFAATLKAFGVGKGDRVLIYMPMIPEAVFAMLATVRLGAIHSVVFGGFAAASLAARIDDAQPKVIVTSDAGMRMGKMIPLKPLVDESIALAKSPPAHVIVVDRGLDKAMNRVAGRDVDYAAAAREARRREGADRVARVQRAVVHPLHERHDRPAQGRAARHRWLRRGARRIDEAHHVLPAWRGLLLHLRHRLGGRPLVHRLRAAHQRLDHDHVRGRADAARRGRVVEDRAGLQGHLDVLLAHGDPRAEEAGSGVDEEVRHLEPALPLPCGRAARRAHREVGLGLARGADHRQLLADRDGWPILTATPGIQKTRLKLGSPSFPAYGYKVKLKHEETGAEVGTNEKGVLCLVPPLPPGAMTTIWGDDERYVETYYRSFKDELVYTTFDWATRDADGYYFVLGRTDDVINVAGHRLGTREIEEAVQAHPNVAEVAVVGVADAVKGQVPMAFAVVKDASMTATTEAAAAHEKEIMATVDKQLGAIARPARVYFVTVLAQDALGQAAAPLHPGDLRGPRPWRPHDDRGPGRARADRRGAEGLGGCRGTSRSRRASATSQRSRSAPARSPPRAPRRSSRTTASSPVAAGGSSCATSATAEAS
jgi:propionyl-CoA synthetase